MQRSPRRFNERLLSPALLATAYLFVGVIQAAWSLLLFFLVLVQGGWTWGQELAPRDPLYLSATGITLVSVVLMQVGNVIGRRSLRFSGFDTGLLRNRLILLGVAVEIGFSWAILHFQPAQEILGTGPVAWQWVALAGLGPVLLFVLDSARKKIMNALDRRKIVP
jgi:sodium/potassium-transporting ATPase subunit alpha